MKLRGYFLVGVGVMMLYNVFLIQRDEKLYQKYYYDQPQTELNTK